MLPLILKRGPFEKRTRARERYPVEALFKGCEQTRPSEIDGAEMSMTGM